MNRIFPLLCFFAALMLAAGCEDRIDYPGGPIEEGISTVAVELGYKDFEPALGSRADGDAIKNINEVWVVLYTTDGKFLKKEKISDFTQKGTTGNTRPDGSPSSETATGHVAFNLTIPNGRYRMYAVVNHDLGGYTDEQLDSEDKLKSLDLTWKDGDPAQNSQMFGWFVNGDKSSDKTMYKPGDTAPTVEVRNNSSQLHAWVRRAASKLTFAINTIGLNEGVWIYLKSITIKDIPRHCYLGRDNDVAHDGYALDVEKNLDGETYYFEGAQASHTGKADHGKWPVIAAGDSVFGLYSDATERAPRGMTKAQRYAREHSEQAPALYFYENMQGQGVVNTPEKPSVTDKRQDANGDKQVDYPDGTKPSNAAWKDGMPWGTYVEVKAYYENNTLSAPGKGDITYRFMLGKDETIDYDAERNTHYRLTLNFHGDANDIDFHIDYQEEAKPGFHVQDTTYVSYLYNQPGHTIVRATPRPGYDFYTLEAVILDNEWRPYSPNPDTDAETRALYNTSAWNWQINRSNFYETSDTTYTPYTITDPATGQTVTAAKNCEFGFLSLRQTHTVTKEMGGGSGDDQIKTLVKGLRKFYFEKEEGVNGGPKGKRQNTKMPSSDVLEQEFPDKLDGSYYVTRKTNPRTKTVDYIVEVPFYTRAKSLDSWATYSGANPYYKHRRYGRVAFIAHYKKADSGVAGPSEYSEVGYTHVMQAYRIDNPRGIYRRGDKLEPFHVVLTHASLTARQIMEGEVAGTISDNDEIYDPIISRGEWSATIECDPHNFVSISANGKTATGTGGTITGRTNTPIAFDYMPTKTVNKDDSFGAIIAVSYHGNSCTHKIVVRHGYGPVVLGTGTEKWSTFNVWTKDSLAKSPLAIGSLFRRHSTLDYPISDYNATKYRVGVDPGINGKLKMSGHGGKYYTWTELEAGAQTYAGAGDAFPNMSLVEPLNGKKLTFRLPKRSELKDIGIVPNKSLTTIPPNILNTIADLNNAFGIAYADGATTTQMTRKAYSFSDSLNTGSPNVRGVRGVVIYSHSKADNVFFPFGMSGHGRRKSRDNSNGSRKAYGVMRYGSVDFKLTDKDAYNNYRPMAYDLPSQSGAAYWVNSGGAEGIAIDFNGGNYMSSYLNAADLFLPPARGQAQQPADACPIKPIYP